jgi:hypothetical protein
VDTGNWLTLLGAVGSAGITFGVMSTKLAAMAKDLQSLREEFNRSRERAGERMEALGKDLAKLQERSRHRPTAPQGVKT